MNVPATSTFARNPRSSKPTDNTSTENEYEKSKAEGEKIVLQAKDKLEVIIVRSAMVFGANEYYFKSMDRGKTYYFQIEAFNENGIGERGPIIESKSSESKSSL
jgi:nucleoside-diphosphate-sugar epimerase